MTIVSAGLGKGASVCKRDASSHKVFDLMVTVRSEYVNSFIVSDLFLQHFPLIGVMP